MNEAKRVPAAKPGAGLDSNLDLSRIKTVEGVDVRGKRVLVRVDFNVPIENGVVADATRLERVLPTIARLAAAGAKVIVLSHLGRPKEGPSSDTSLRPVAMKMRELMPGRKVHFIGDCVGEEPRRNLATLEARRDCRARKSPLLSRRGKERQAVRQAARGARRHLCQRRLLHRPQGACLGRRDHRSSALSCRTPDDGRDRSSRARARKPRAAGDGHCRRGQGLDQDRSPHSSRHAHGRACRRRGHGQHLPSRARHQDRLIAERARFRRNREGDHGARRKQRLRGRPAERRRDCGRS